MANDEPAKRMATARANMNARRINDDCDLANNTLIMMMVAMELR